MLTKLAYELLTRLCKPVPRNTKYYYYLFIKH